MGFLTFLTLQGQRNNEVENSYRSIIFVENNKVTILKVLWTFHTSYSGDQLGDKERISVITFRQIKSSFMYSMMVESKVTFMRVFWVCHTCQLRGLMD